MKMRCLSFIRIGGFSPIVELPCKITGGITEGGKAWIKDRRAPSLRSGMNYIASHRAAKSLANVLSERIGLEAILVDFQGPDLGFQSRTRHTEFRRCARKTIYTPSALSQRGFNHLLFLSSKFFDEVKTGF